MTPSAAETYIHATCDMHHAEPLWCHDASRFPRGRLKRALLCHRARRSLQGNPRENKQTLDIFTLQIATAPLSYLANWPAAAA